MKIDLPDLVVEAAARYLCEEDGVPLEDGDLTWPAYEPQARAAILAALSAWPGVETGLFAKGERNVLATILPQEPGDE